MGPRTLIGRCRQRLASWKTRRSPGARRGDRRIVVLAYHDLREQLDFSSWLRLPVDTFREHLAALQRRGTFIGPEALTRPDELARQRISFLMTFDDGCSNTFRLGLPVLQELGVPAIFFLSTHHVLSGEPFWFDRVITPIQAASVRVLDLREAGLGRYSLARRDGPRRWDGIQRLLEDLKRLGNPDDARVERVLHALEARWGHASGPWNERYRPLRPEEVRTMAEVPLCHFGSHGHRHEIMTRLSDKALAETLVRSRLELEKLTGRTVFDLAYPNGDADDRVRVAARHAGYQRGFTVQAGVLDGSDDAYGLPRLLVGGYDSAAALLSRIDDLLLGAARPS
jgi:peptidoglycan/xylan/chitin deacetylase (PgdA/CDA1 family)